MSETKESVAEGVKIETAAELTKVIIVDYTAFST